MRENKFRAFKNGSWWYSDDEAYNLKEYDGVLYLYEDVKFYRNTEEYELEIIGVACQYTGLKDKNGVEIYEGDIVKYKYISREQIAEIKYNKQKLGFDFTDNKVNLSYAYNFRQINNIEIIGNIYENPELLREG